MIYPILGILLIVIGFKMYSYFGKNEESIDNKPGNLYSAAVLLIIMGIILLIFSMFTMFS